MTSMQKEIWFTPSYEPSIISGVLTRTLRDQVAPEKNNNYQPGDILLSRFHVNRSFSPDAYLLEILRVKEALISELKETDFDGSDMHSREELLERFQTFYGRQYRDADGVRVIDFKYLF